MAKPILVSGIQPTGRLHLGNYLGAVKNFVDLQNSDKYECYFFIADLHSLTEEFSPKEKSKQILELTADYLALGLNKKSTIFLQSQIPAHSELMWILQSLTPMGELRRMTQYKEKSEDERDSTNAGLFTYPVLMAADILLYDAKFVPVGEDQLQHLELTRALARKFNAKFGKTFTEPKSILTEAARIMNLTDPTKKMSKSQPQHCIFLDDTPENIREKIKRAVTDSGNEIIYEPDKKPAISNLLKIYSALTHKSIEKLEKEFSSKTYAEFKTKLAELVINYFADYRAKKKALLIKPQALKTTLTSGSKKAGVQSARKISEIKKIIGIAL